MKNIKKPKLVVKDASKIAIENFEEINYRKGKAVADQDFELAARIRSGEEDGAVKKVVAALIVDNPELAQQAFTKEFSREIKALLSGHDMGRPRG